MDTLTPKTVSSAEAQITPNSQPRFWLGVDGGGTNCRAVIADDAGKTLGEGRAEAANFLRVGLGRAVSHVKQAVHQACAQAGIGPSQVTAACIGLAGVSHPDHNRQMLGALKEALPIKEILLETDAVSVRRTQLARAVPFALEDQLASPVEELHFALPERLSEVLHGRVRHARPVLQ